MKHQIIEVSESLRVIVGLGVKKDGKGKDAEWIDDDTKVRISTEYCDRSGSWKPGRGGIQFPQDDDHIESIMLALESMMLVSPNPKERRNGKKPAKKVGATGSRKREHEGVPSKDRDRGNSFVVGQEVIFDHPCKFQTFEYPAPGTKWKKGTMIKGDIVKIPRNTRAWEITKVTKNGFLTIKRGRTREYIIKENPLEAKIAKLRASVTEID